MQNDSNASGRLVIVGVILLGLNLLGFFWLSASLFRVSNSLSEIRDALPDTASASSHSQHDSLGTNLMPSDPATVSGLKVPGISNPAFCSASQVSIADDTRIIGIEVNGESRAYVLDAFEAPERITDSQDLSVHIVNDVLGQEPIVVTHCDRTHSTRVLTLPGDGAATSAELDVCVGGFDAEMLLVLGESVYEQNASDLPLADVPYITTTWIDWLEEHPDSLIYTGQPCES